MKSTRIDFKIIYENNKEVFKEEMKSTEIDFKVTYKNNKGVLKEVMKSTKIDFKNIYTKMINNFKNKEIDKDRF